MWVKGRFQGDCPLFFELETPHAHRLVVQSGEIMGVCLSDSLLKQLHNLPGEKSVYIKY